MLRQMLRSKIHRATLTRTDLHYHGSITLPADLCKAADIVDAEVVQVCNVNTGARIMTYVIEGDDPGEICLNGAAARTGEPGDLIIVMAFAMVSEEELASGWKPRVLEMNPDNTVASVH